MPVFHITGTGTYSPGLPLTGGATQTVTLSMTVVAVDSDVAGTYIASMSGGTHGVATMLSESGSGTLSGDLSGSISWSRTGPGHTVTAEICINGWCYCITASAFAWVYFDINPTVSFGITGKMTARPGPC